MRLNEKGKQLYDKFENFYVTELERLRKEKNDPEYIEGWCIIDNNNYVQDIEDEIGLLIYGYDEFVFDVLSDWENVEYAFGLTGKEIKQKLEEYYV